MRKRNPEERRRTMKRYREKNKEKLAEKRRAYQKRRPEVYRLSTMKSYHKRKHIRLATRLGVKVEEIKALPECCEICGSAEKLRIDHCHATNTLRGRLCDSCNTGLGLFKDSTALLSAASAYLIRYQRRIA